MDHPLYIPYATPNGVPQESKLATYMNRQSTSTPVVVNSNLSQSFSKISVDSPISSKKVSPESPAFIPGGLRSVSANATASYGYSRIHSPQSASVSPHLTPQPSPPPIGINNCSPIPHAAPLEKPIGTVAYQENVGGTTYFYPTNSNDNSVNTTTNGGGGSNTGGGNNPGAGGNNNSSSTGNNGGGGGGVSNNSTLNSTGGGGGGNGGNNGGDSNSGSNTVTSQQHNSSSNSTSGGYHHHPHHHQHHHHHQQHHLHGLQPHHQVYPGTPSHVSTLRVRQQGGGGGGSGGGGAGSAFFIGEDARMELLHRNALTLLQANPEEFPDLPQEVDNYHDLYPLEPIPMHKAHMGYQASMYKATNIKTGVRYCLRRIHGFRLQNAKCMTFVDMWKKLVHSNIVQLKEVFTTKAFGDNSMVFVYDYHPGSETLLTKHFSPDQLNGYSDPFASDPGAPRPYSHQKNNLLRHQQTNKLPEPLIWNYIIQLTSALRIIHSNGLACRSLDPTKIIITSGNRLRLSCLGVMDVIMSDAASNQVALVQHFQQEDLSALGKLVLALGCKSTMAVQPNNITTAVDVVTRTYTNDLRNLLMYLLSAQQRRSVTDLMPMIGARFYTQLDSVQSRADILENEVSKEMENGRLFRLMVKLGTINERPEFNMGGSWSETGDRYMLKLFRDYVFHQVTEDGHAWLDMAHVVQCLNKLDAGVPEKVCLTSRDEQSILVVSYSELKHCLEQSFEEILSESGVVLSADHSATT